MRIEVAARAATSLATAEGTAATTSRPGVALPRPEAGACAGRRRPARRRRAERGPARPSGSGDHQADPVADPQQLDDVRVGDPQRHGGRAGVAAQQAAGRACARARHAARPGRWVRRACVPPASRGVPDRARRARTPGGNRDLRQVVTGRGRCRWSGRGGRSTPAPSPGVVGRRPAGPRARPRRRRARRAGGGAAARAGGADGGGAAGRRGGFMAPEPRPDRGARAADNPQGPAGRCGQAVLAAEEPLDRALAGVLLEPEPEVVGRRVLPPGSASVVRAVRGRRLRGRRCWTAWRGCRCGRSPSP